MRGPARRAGPPPAGRARRRAVRSGGGGVRRSARCSSDQSGTGPLVLFVDDLHLLDSTSATLVGQLVDADLLFLVATVRSTESVPRGLESLWHKARVRRIDLDDLDRAAVDTLLHLDAAAGRSRPAPSPSSGRPARATSSSSGSWSWPGWTAASSSSSGASGGWSARSSPHPACTSCWPPVSAASPPERRRRARRPRGVGAGRPVDARGDRSARAARARSTAPALLAVRTEGRRQQVSAGPPALRRDPPRPHAGRSPAGGSCSRTPTASTRTAPGGGRMPSASPRPGWRPPAGPTPPSSSGPPAWPATARTSSRSSGWRGPRCSAA